MRSEDRRRSHRPGKGHRSGRYLSDIRTVAELRAARRELEIRERYARRRFEENASELLSVEGLLSVFAPPGSIADRLIGGVGTGLAVVRGIVGTVGSLFSGRETWSGRAAHLHHTARAHGHACHTAHAHAAHAHTAHAHTAHNAAAHTAAARKPAVKKVAVKKTAVRKAPAKKN